MSQYMELFKAAYKVAKEYCDIRLGENVVIVTDSLSDPRATEALAAAAHAVGGNVTVINFNAALRAATEPSAPVAAAVKAADVVIENDMNYIFYTKPMLEAAEHVRLWIGFGYDADDLVRLVGKVDTSSMLEFGEFLRHTITKARKIRITNKAGTDLVGMNDGREVRQVGGTYSSALAAGKERGVILVPPGQVNWNPVEKTMNGTIVFNGSLWTPDFVINLVGQPPVEMKIHEGTVLDTKSSSYGDKLKDWLASWNDPLMYRIAHISIGFIPTAKPEPKPNNPNAETERVFGRYTIGLGTQSAELSLGAPGWVAKSHCDCALEGVSLWLDDEQIQADGKFIHPKLYELAKKMGAKGYT